MAYYERYDKRIKEQEIPFTSDSEKQALNDMKQILSNELAKDNRYHDVTDYTLFRFIRFNSFNSQKAANAFHSYVEWRSENDIDNILKKPVPKIDLIQKIVPYAYHGYDKEGRPVYMEKTGQMLTSAVRNNIVTTDEFCTSHIWGLENLAVLAYNKSIETGQRIESFATVIDMNGLSFGHKDAIPLLTACTKIDNSYFPERIGKLYIINLPWIAPALYQLVQPLVDPVTKTRIHPIHEDAKEFLPTVIDRQYLPKEYGGTCTCIDKPYGKELGCIPEYDTSEIVAQISGTVDEESYPDNAKRMNVNYEYEEVLECDADGGIFTWWFVSEGGYDIDFSIEDITNHESNQHEPVYVKSPSRCVTSKGSWETKKASKLLFRWDNNFSYFYSKDIAYLLSVTKNELNIQTSANPDDINAEQMKLQKGKQS